MFAAHLHIYSIAVCTRTLARLHAFGTRDDGGGIHRRAGSIRSMCARTRKGDPQRTLRTRKGTRRLTGRSLPQERVMHAETKDTPLSVFD